MGIILNLDEIISEMNLGGKIKDTRERKEILRSELAEFAGVSEDYIADSCLFLKLAHLPASASVGRKSSQFDLIVNTI